MSPSLSTKETTSEVFWSMCGKHDKYWQSDELTITNCNVLGIKLGHLFDNQLMTDITLVVGQQEHPSHRVILSASSDVFLAMLSNPLWKENKEARIVLHEKDEDQKVFKDFLSCMYTGQIRLSCDNVLPLTNLADKYNCKELFKMGLQYMVQTVAKALRKNHLVSWLAFITDKGNKEQANLCRDFITNNFYLFATESQDFPEMHPDVLLTFIKCDDLVIQDEISLFQCIHKWIQAQRERIISSGKGQADMLEVNHYARSLLTHVRFPMMASTQLNELLHNPTYKDIAEFMEERINSALRFHKGQQQLLSLTEEARYFKPRLYTLNAVRRQMNQIWWYTHKKDSPEGRRRGWDMRRLLYFTSDKYSAEHLGEDSYDWTLAGCNCTRSSRANRCFHDTPVEENHLDSNSTLVERDEGFVSLSICMGRTEDGEMSSEQIAELRERFRGYYRYKRPQTMPNEDQRSVRVGILFHGVSDDGVPQVLRSFRAAHHFSGDSVLKIDMPRAIQYTHVIDMLRVIQYMYECGPDGVPLLSKPDVTEVTVIVVPA